jgi:hypothetical protein
MGVTNQNQSTITGKRIKVEKTIPAGITIHYLGFHHTSPDHAFRCFSVIRLFFFGPFTCQADGPVIEDGQDTLVPGSQFRVASITCDRTGQVVFPLVLH